MGDEVKVEEWMITAARLIVETEDEGSLFRTIRNAMEASEGRRAGTDRDAVRKTYEALARIIATHMPKPRFSPGDRVQLTDGERFYNVGTVVQQADKWDVKWDDMSYDLTYSPDCLVLFPRQETD